MFLAIIAFIYAASVKVAALLFRRSDLSWRAISLLTVTSLVLTAIALLAGHAEVLLGLSQSASLLLQLTSAVAAWIIPIEMIRRFLHMKLLQSIALFAVASVFSISLSIGTALAIRTFAFQAFKIPSGAMAPTLLVGDHLLANKFIYRLRDPVRGEIVIFKYPKDPSKDFIKRVIGLPGDTIEIRDKILFINGQSRTEEYVKHTDERILPLSVSARDNLEKMVVPQHSFFVMGDNRDESYDSRFWQFVEASSLKGKATYIYWANDRARIGMQIK
jgi:signal peptidase I